MDNDAASDAVMVVVAIAVFQDSRVQLYISAHDGRGSSDYGSSYCDRMCGGHVNFHGDKDG